MDYRGRMLESLSDISVLAHDGTLVAEGWMDFVVTSAKSDASPKVFWLFLSVAEGGIMKEVKEDSFLPKHLWDSLTDVERRYIATTQPEWSLRDPKIQRWNQRNSRVPER